MQGILMSRALDYAHLRGKKIYLTLNTLIKECEFGALQEFLEPYYLNGLDGIIVQDIGVISFVKEAFPLLDVHISTQMTITGEDGAAFARRIGATRIVPARELSLDEIKQIHQAYPEMEIECFIHGAMCYCYSGQCLFSSIVGGRSGNRGTCAQPCRLEYDVQAGGELYQNQYALSLKDMMSAGLLPELIEAGISSFKIEGRMKSAEYVAGVTGIYRELIDAYYKDPSAYQGPNKKQIELLNSLYVRSKTLDGYYHRHNGKEMLTGNKPCYNGSQDESIAFVREHFMKEPKGASVEMYFTFMKHNPMMLTVSYGDVSVTAEGMVVEQADSKPLQEKDLITRLSKTGDTGFYAESVLVTMDQDGFAPVSAINEVRREALQLLADEILSGNRRAPVDDGVASKKNLQIESPNNASENNEENPAGKAGEKSYAIALSQPNQAYQVALLDDKIKSKIRLYLDECIFGNRDVMNALNGMYISYAFPRILRLQSRERIIKLIRSLTKKNIIRGVYVHTPDELELALNMKEECEGLEIRLSPFMYVMNAKAGYTYSRFCDSLSAPYELNEKELHDLFRGRDAMPPVEMPIYGRIPLMVSAGCVTRNFSKKGCVHQSGYERLTDRKGNILPVYRSCENCYNIIYNKLPLSLHKVMDRLDAIFMISAYLICFTDETPEQTYRILSAYLNGNYEAMASCEYTGGHFKRGVI